MRAQAVLLFTSARAIWHGSENYCSRLEELLHELLAFSYSSPLSCQVDFSLVLHLYGTWRFGSIKKRKKKEKKTETNQWGLVRPTHGTTHFG